MNMSLMAIMRDDPDMAKRLEEGTKEVRQTKKHLMANAAEFTELYSKEIEEGTKKRQLLLEYGKQHGKGEAAVLMEYGKFIPSKETPIMNFLYFLMRDGNHPDWLGIHQKLNETYGHSEKESVKQVAQAMSEDELDKIFGLLVHEDEKYVNVQEPDEVDRFIYGNMSHDMFVKIKKLKALSKSPNENEAFLAYRLALKLCNKYGLEFDKIPCQVE
jgi:hypothetical protein